MGVLSKAREIAGDIRLGRAEPSKLVDFLLGPGIKAEDAGSERDPYWVAWIPNYVGPSKMEDGRIAWCLTDPTKPGNVPASEERFWTAEDTDHAIWSQIRSDIQAYRDARKSKGLPAWHPRGLTVWASPDYVGLTVFEKVKALRP